MEGKVEGDVGKGEGCPPLIGDSGSGSGEW